MSVVRRIQIGENHKSAEVLNRPTDDILTLSGLTPGATFPGFVNYPTLTGEVGVTSNLYPVGNVKRYGAVGNGVADDTTAINTAIATASTLAIAAGQRDRVSFPDGIYLTDGVLVKPSVWVDFGQATIRKRSNGGTAATNSLLRAVPVLTNTTYYGTYQNIKITGGRLESNGFTCPAHIVNLIFCEDLVMEGVTVVHSAANATWGFCLGGRRLALRNLKVLGGTVVLQDGVHIVHGQYITVDGVYAESGDDAFVVSTGIADANIAADPDPVRYVTASNITTKAAKGAAVKVYVDSGATGSLWEVTDIVVRGVVGTAGITRNGGISVVDLNDTARGTSQIQRVRISEVSLLVGSTTHDETNAYGVWIASATGVTVDGAVQMIDKTAAVTGFALAKVSKSDIVDLTLGCPALQKAGGFVVTSSRRVKINQSVVLSGTTQASPTVSLTDAEITKISRCELTGVPTGVDVIQIAGGTLTELYLAQTTLAHAAGAAAGIGLNTTSARFTHLTVVDNDFSGCFSAAAGTSIVAGTSFLFSNNKGYASEIRATSTVAAALTSIVVTHTAPMTTFSLSNISVFPASTWGATTKWWISTITATQFTINVDIAPGGSGMDFRWIVNTSRKPVL